MKLLVLAIAVAAAAPRGEAAEPTPPALELRPKAAMVSTVNVAKSRYAPFATPSAEPELELIPRRDPREETSRSSCSGERALCYDPTSGRIVYKPARSLMPDIPGLQRENISVKRDRIVFRYSF